MAAVSCHKCGDSQQQLFAVQRPKSVSLSPNQDVSGAAPGGRCGDSPLLASSGSSWPGLWLHLPSLQRQTLKSPACVLEGADGAWGSPR